jgi:hypothetical protein
MSEAEAKFSELVNDGIRKTVTKFREHPRIFFSEMDIHSYLYHCLYSTRLEAKTKDGVTTSCLHKEYPTNFRFNKETMEDYGLTKKGVRGHFDFAVLNPQFIQENSIATVENKNIRGTETKSKSEDKLRNELLTAIELKYVVNNSRKFINEVEKDIKKLSIGLKYQSFEAYNLVFCNCKYHYIVELTKLIEMTESKIKSILVMSNYTNDKKYTPKPITNGWNFKHTIGKSHH